MMWSNLSLVIFADISDIDPMLSLYAVVAFVVIGICLTLLILYTKAKFVGSEMCTIKINSDESLTVKTPGGGTLLNALTSHGVPIPSPCGGKAAPNRYRLFFKKTA